VTIEIRDNVTIIHVVCRDKFTPALLDSLADKSWKVRGEGLQKINDILKEAKFINGNLGSLPESLKGRLVDANKILVSILVVFSLMV